MTTTGVRQSAGTGGLASSSANRHFEIHENTRGLLHRIRVWYFGECPRCKSTHNKQVKGWDKLRCENCGETWNYSLF
jgi:hypothetical protein